MKKDLSISRLTKIVVITVVCTLLFGMLAVEATAKTKYNEAYYVARDCMGKVEYRLSDRTRVDCLTVTHAIEYDFANKWAEAIGQALHYSNMTGVRGGIVLLLKKPSDIGKVRKVEEIIKAYNLPIDVESVPVWGDK